MAATGKGQKRKKTASELTTDEVAKRLFPKQVIQKVKADAKRKQSQSTDPS
jgi:hypothetical protein